MRGEVALERLGFELSESLRINKRWQFALLLYCEVVLERLVGWVPCDGRYQLVAIARMATIELGAGWTVRLKRLIFARMR